MQIELKPAIQIKQLSKSYKSRSGEVINAVNELDLNIDAGQVFGFLGANGGWQNHKHQNDVWLGQANRRRSLSQWF